uniref:VPS13 domain-containing protein n=1 Tax=Heterorhabditis bacteriophora TaxID=37862 RepID=A0A1I7W7I8_HETBA
MKKKQDRKKILCSIFRLSFTNTTSKGPIVVYVRTFMLSVTIDDDNNHNNSNNKEKNKNNLETARMVFESIVADLLNRFLGDFVDNLDSSQLNIGIWGVYHLFLFQTRKNAADVKQKTLLRLEEGRKNRRKPPDPVADTFAEKMVTQIIKNLQVSVSNIHVRFEDKYTNRHRPFVAGITLEKLDFQTTDDNWIPTIHKEAVKVIHKLVSLNNLSIYWNSNAELMSDLSDKKEIKKRLHEAIHDGKKRPIGYNSGTNKNGGEIKTQSETRDRWNKLEYSKEYLVHLFKNMFKAILGKTILSYLVKDILILFITFFVVYMCIISLLGKKSSVRSSIREVRMDGCGAEMLRVRDPSQPWLDLIIDTYPLDGKYDQLVQLAISPVNLKYHAPAVNNAIDVFKPPESVKLNQLTAVAMSRYEEVKSRSVTGLAHAVEKKSKLVLDIKIQPARLMISEGGIFNASKPTVLADLGMLTISTIEQKLVHFIFHKFCMMFVYHLEVICSVHYIPIHIFLRSHLNYKEINIFQIGLIISRGDNVLCNVSVLRMSCKLQMRTFDMVIMAELGAVQVSLPTFRSLDPKGDSLYLIDNNEKDGALMKLKFVQANPESPFFSTEYQMTEQAIDFKFSRLNVSLHQQGLMELKKFGENLQTEIASLHKGQDDKMEVIEEGTRKISRKLSESMESLALLARETQSTAAAEKRKRRKEKKMLEADPLIIKMRIEATIGSLAVFIGTENALDTIVAVENVCADVKMTLKTMELTASLHTIKMEDMTYGALYRFLNSAYSRFKCYMRDLCLFRKLLSVAGDKEMLKFEMTQFQRTDAEKKTMLNTDVDMKVKVRLAQMRFVFLNLWLSRLMAWLAPFQEEAVRAANAAQTVSTTFK